MSQVLANRYKVLSELGRGGMGTVYRVSDGLDGDRQVALKTIRMEGAITPELKLRFQEEFRTMSKLKHPNTIEVFEYGQLDQQTQFLTMEIVPGAEMTALIHAGPMPLEQFYTLLIQLLQALGFIHSRLYVHRDIKAENIRVDESGTLKLMDFGLMDQLGNPSTGKITGTPGYLPPEVAKGGVIDASSDIYSVGCLAFEMLTGHLPFQGSLLEVIRAHVGKEPPALRAWRPDVPPALEQIVLKMLAKDQTVRYQTTAEIVSELAELSGTQVARQNLAQKNSYLTSSVMVGRDRELQLLEAGLADAKAGRGRSIFVGAPAGVGKSRLVQELVLQAKLGDVAVLHGQCLEGGNAAYQPMIQAMRPVLALSTDAEVLAHGPVLVKLFPELAQRGIAPAPMLEAGLERIRTNETVAAWLQTVSARGALVLFLDDLHWADLGSVNLFNHLIRAQAAHQLFCLATFRSDEAPAGSPLWFTIEEGFTELLKLDAFSLPQVMLLLRAMLRELDISRDVAQFLFDSTAGNAFFLTEVLRYLMEQGVLVLKEGVWHFPQEVGSLDLPASVEATVLRRLQSLLPDTLRLARVASVLGRYQDLEMLLNVSGLGEDALFAGLDELVAGQFLLRVDTGYTFPHDRVREALYADMPDEARRTIHQACGDYLERLHAANTGDYARDLGFHFSRGHERTKAYEYLRLAGNQALKAGEAASAFAFWHQADLILEGIPYPNKEARQVELWWDLGYHAYQVVPKVASEALLKLLPVLERQGSIDFYCTMLKQVAALIRRMPKVVRDRAFLELTKPVPYTHPTRPGALRHLPPDVRTWVPRTIETITFLSVAYGFAGEPAKGLALIDRAIDLMPFPGTPLAASLFCGKCATLLPAGRFAEMVEISERYAQFLFTVDLAGQPTPMAARTTIGYANARAYQGYRPNEAQRDQALAAADAIESIALYNIIRHYWGVWHAWTGRQEGAQEFIEVTTQHSRRMSAPPFAWVLYLRPYLLWQQGEFDEALSLCQQALRYPHMADDAFTLQALRILQGRVHLALGDPDQARALFEDAERIGRAGQLGLVTIQALLGRGEEALAAGRLDAARGHLEAARRLASPGATENPLHRAIADRLLGEVALAAGEAQQALEHWALAMAVVALPEQDNLIEQAHLYRNQGDAWQALGDLARAREAWKQAGLIYHELKNRYHVRPISRRLEALDAGPLEHRVPAPLPSATATRRSTLDVHLDRLGSLSSVALGDHAGLLQSFLETCQQALEGDEASLFEVIAGEPRWIASRQAGQACTELPFERSLLDSAIAEGAGRYMIAMPEHLALGAGSNLECEFPSLLCAPVLHEGQMVGLVALLKRNLVNPYAEEGLADLSMLCDAFSPQLAARLAARLAKATYLAEELRQSFFNVSLDEAEIGPSWETALREYATKLGLSSVAVVRQSDGSVPAFGYPSLADLPPLNVTFVQRVAESGQSLCAIDLPSDLTDASNVGAEIASVMITPLDEETFVYGIRSDLSNPISEEDIPSFEACALVLRDWMKATR